MGVPFLQTMDEGVLPGDWRNFSWKTFEAGRSSDEFTTFKSSPTALVAGLARLGICESSAGSPLDCAQPDAAFICQPAVRQWKFAPARLKGTPVDVIVEVSVEFTLR